MRFILAAVLLFATSALAAPVEHKNNRSTEPDLALPAMKGGNTTVVPVRTPSGGVLGRPGGQQDRSGGRPHMPRHHHDHDGWGFPYPYPPYPETWPYPPSPYSQYYYPYPPQYYSGDYSDDDNTYSTRGLVVPGDLPVGVTSYWYYCDTPDGYYPYVKSCTRPWTRIPVSPPPPGVAPPLSYSDWEWCAESKSFFPYVTSCKDGFQPVPVTTPSSGNAGPPAAANWFFCEDPKGYAPYVVQCRRDWRPVPAVPPPSVKITVKDESGKDEKKR